jgi:hypothetical protein
MRGFGYFVKDVIALYIEVDTLSKNNKYLGFNYYLFTYTFKLNVRFIFNFLKDYYKNYYEIFRKPEEGY